MASVRTQGEQGSRSRSRAFDVADLMRHEAAVRAAQQAREVPATLRTAGGAGPSAASPASHASPVATDVLCAPAAGSRPAPFVGGRMHAGRLAVVLQAVAALLILLVVAGVARSRRDQWAVSPGMPDGGPTGADISAPPPTSATASGPECEAGR